MGFLSRELFLRPLVLKPEGALGFDQRPVVGYQAVVMEAGSYVWPFGSSKGIQVSCSKESDELGVGQVVSLSLP